VEGGYSGGGYSEGGYSKDEKVIGENESKSKKIKKKYR
jgi:hypothetical protein